MTESLKNDIGASLLTILVILVFFHGDKMNKVKSDQKPNLSIEKQTETNINSTADNLTEIVKIKPQTNNFVNHFNSRKEILNKVCSTDFADYKKQVCNGEIKVDPEIPPAIRVSCDGKIQIKGTYWIGDTE